VNHEAGFFSDPIVWYALAVAVCVGGAWWKLRQPVLGWLDGEIAGVVAELKQAKKLRAEAESALALYGKKQKAALKEAEAIVAHARDEAARLRAAAEADLKAALESRERQAMERIRLAEAEAVEAVRKAMVEQAVAAAETVLVAQLDGAALEHLADQAIAEVPHLVSTKARAA
jgi:F-type H+-transporting ATPase subunit b